MNNEKRLACPECNEHWSRRDFVKAAGAAALASGALPLAGGVRRAAAAPTSSSPAETAAKRLYESLSDEQRKTICFPFNHPLRA